jgi:hypothetical protein
MAEKTYTPAPSAFSPYLDTVASLFHPVAGPVYNSTARFHGWKESMGLVQPGTVENLTREVSRMSICDRIEMEMKEKEKETDQQRFTLQTGSLMVHEPISLKSFPQTLHSS